MVIFIFLVLLAGLSVKCLGYWIGLLVLVRWMETKKMPQPSDEERKELVRWVASNILRDLKKI